MAVSASTHLQAQLPPQSSHHEPDTASDKENTTTSGDSDSGHEVTFSSSSSAHENEENEVFVDTFEEQPDGGQPTDEGGAPLAAKTPNEQASRQAPLSNGALREAANETGQLNETDIERSVREVRGIVRLALSNEFARAIGLCAPRAQTDLYSSLANATLCFLRAALTMEPNDLQEAVGSINDCYDLSNKLRRSSSMVMRLLYRPNYNSYTDAEVHAELVNAETLLLSSLASFFADQSIFCLVKGAFRIRSCYQRYKECMYIMEHRSEWQSEQARGHFESGVRMGHGMFNLLMSYLPRKMLRLLEYVGFSGNRSLGMEELRLSVALDDGLRSVLSTLFIIFRYSYCEILFGLGEYDFEEVERMNESLAQVCPNGAFYLLFKARYYQLKGDVDAAIEHYDRCIKSQDQWRQFHALCHWETMWCKAAKQDWTEAARLAEGLVGASKWSPASFAYQRACFTHAQLMADLRSGACERDSAEFHERAQVVRDWMERVPKLRTRYAGKTIPAEKFAITRAEMFARQEDRLRLPALEFFYIWNIFITVRNASAQNEALLELVEHEIASIRAQMHQEGAAAENTNGAQADAKTTNKTTTTATTATTTNDDHEAVDNSFIQDQLHLVLLLKAMCLKNLNRFAESESCLMNVIENEDLIKHDTFLVPHATMELVQLKVLTKNYDEAKQLIKKGRSYTGYLHETIVHFRLHAASRALRLAREDADSALYDESNEHDHLEIDGAEMEELKKVKLQAQRA